MTRIPAFAILATFFESDISSSISLAVAAQLPFLFENVPAIFDGPLWSATSTVGKQPWNGAVSRTRPSFWKPPWRTEQLCFSVGLGRFVFWMQDEVPVPKALLGKAQWGDGNLGPACGC